MSQGQTLPHAARDRPLRRLGRQHRVSSSPGPLPAGVDAIFQPRTPRVAATPRPSSSSPAPDSEFTGSFDPISADRHRRRRSPPPRAPSRAPSRSASRSASAFDLSLPGPSYGDVSPASPGFRSRCGATSASRAGLALGGRSRERAPGELRAGRITSRTAPAPKTPTSRRRAAHRARRPADAL